MQKSLTIVENSQNQRIKDLANSKSCKILQEKRILNNKILNDIEARNKLKARFHKKIRSISITGFDVPANTWIKIIVFNLLD